MHGQRGGWKTQCLQRGNLLALDHHDPPQSAVEQERRNPEENERNRNRHHLLLVQLVLEEAVRRLISPLDGADRSVLFKQPVQFIDNRLRIGARRQRNDGVIEGCLHIEGGFRRTAVDPKDRIEPIVGNRQARLDGIDIFGRKRDAGDVESFHLPVEQDADVVSGVHSVDFRERFVNRCSSRRARLGRRATAQMKPGEPFVARTAERHHPRRHRLGCCRPIDDDLTNDAGLNRGNAGNCFQLRDDRQRCPLETHEDLREPRSRVEALHGRIERFVSGDRPNEDGDAGCDQQRDRQHLAPHRADVTQQFSIEQAHQCTSSAESRCALRSSPTIRPPPSRSTRSAMPAIAALCVMMIVVVPRRSLARAIAASTTLPVS